MSVLQLVAADAGPLTPDEIATEVCVFLERLMPRCSDEITTGAWLPLLANLQDALGRPRGVSIHRNPTHRNDGGAA